MKKLLVLIGLIISLAAYSQNETWSVSSQGKNDTIAFPSHRDVTKNWLGQKVFVTITIWDVEALDGNFYIGGYSEAVSGRIKDKFAVTKPDWTYYGTADDGTDISPVVADTTGTGWIYNADSSAFNYRIAISNFALPRPGFIYHKNNTDSTNYNITFEKVKD